MSTSTTLGMMRHPIAMTALSLLPFASLDFYIIYEVLAARAHTKTYFGSESASAVKQTKDKALTGKSDAADFDPLAVATRTHANFVENVPLALIFAAAIELSGGDKTTLGYLLATLFAARVAHAVGMKGNIQPLRAFGFFTTSLLLLGLGGWASWLGYQGLA